MTGPQSYLLVLAVALAATAVTVPLVRKLCVRVGAMAEPNERSVHTTPMATLGGISLYIGVVAAFGAAAFLGEFADVFESSQIIGVIGALTIAFLVGLVDDLRDISAPAKTAGLVLAGSVLALSGVGIIFFRVPFVDLVALSPDLSALVTVLWLFGMCNAINLIDGLDGLAAGIVAIGSASFLAYSHQLSREGVLESGNVGPLIAVAATGVCVGFLVFNVHPASIIMGDSGALMLGAMVAASTAAVGGNSPDPYSGQSWFFFAPIVVPLLILAIPILDTAWSIIRRAVKRTGVATADRNHVHHRLMDLGHGHRRTVFVLWAWTALLSGFVLVPVYTGRGNSLVPLAVIAMGLGLFTAFAPIVSRRGSSAASAAKTADDAARQAETVAPSQPFGAEAPKPSEGNNP